jgi:AcrR family transcriptional regulator
MSSRLPAARRKEQLLEVALPVFAERGFHLTSMNDVADAAGVTKPVLYQHFSSKRGLYLELLRSVGDRLMATIQAATSRADHPREQVEAGLCAYFTFVAEQPHAYRLMFGGGTRRDAEFAGEAARVERAIAGAIAPLIRIEGLPDHERLLFAHGIVGLAEGTTRHWVTDDVDLEPRQVAELVADLAWRGLRGVRSDSA